MKSQLYRQLPYLALWALIFLTACQTPVPHQAMSEALEAVTHAQKFLENNEANSYQTRQIQIAEQSLEEGKSAMKSAHYLEAATYLERAKRAAQAVVKARDMPPIENANFRF